AEDALAALLRCLKGESDKGVKETAAYSLGQICRRGRAPEEVLAELCRLLSNPNEDPLVRRSAAVALGGCGTDTPAVRAALEQALAEKKDNPDEDKKLDGVRQNAACATLAVLVQKGDGAALAVLAGFCKDEDEDLEVRRNAALALANIGDPGSEAAVPVLRDALKNGDIELKRLAALAFQNLGERGAGGLPELALAARSQDRELRYNA